MKKCLLLTIVFLAARPLCAQVELIAIHGKVWTENPQQPEAEAVAILNFPTRNWRHLILMPLPVEGKGERLISWSFRVRKFTK